MFRNRFYIAALSCASALTLPVCSNDSGSENNEDQVPVNGTDTAGINDTGTGAADSAGTDTGGGGVDDEGVENEPDNTKDVITAEIVVPSEFNCQPVLLSTMFFSIDSEGGMPDAFGDSFANPEVVAGEVFAITTTQAGLEGDYYLAIVLYCEGGGNGQFPVTGVDWQGEIETAVTLGPGTGTIDVGEIPLFLAD